jgi:hypothetical protein
MESFLVKGFFKDYSIGLNKEKIIYTEAIEKINTLNNQYYSKGHEITNTILSILN